MGHELTAHEVRTAAQMGWEQLKNGKLLAAAAKAFDIVVTTDKNIRFQQNLSRLPVPVIEFDGPDARLPALKSMMRHFDEALRKTQTSRYVVIHPDGLLETFG